MDYLLTSSVQILTRLTFTCITLLSVTPFSVAQTGPADEDLFAQENLVAWCIVPFDNQHRTPKERIAMLRRLNFSQYAYDWRHQHLASFPEEIRLAKENKVHIAAVWMWIDNETDRPGKLSDDNERLLQILEEAGLFTQLWVGFNSNFFADENESDKISKGVQMLAYLRERTKLVVSGIGLYNHGDWFGEPENQIKILTELNDPGMGLIYNFHHAHDQIDSFPILLKKMSPWLWTVNVNGMKKDGPQILPIGNGDSELDMLRTLRKSKFHGSIGILGHVEDKDVEIVLRQNLDGLRRLEKEF